MKVIGPHRNPVSEKTSELRTQKIRTTRISPFLLITVFLILWLPYTLITEGRIETTAKIIIFPFLVSLLILGDFAIWNYFEGKKKLNIWILESIISALILYLFF